MFKAACHLANSKLVQVVEKFLFLFSSFFTVATFGQQLLYFAPKLLIGEFLWFFLFVQKQKLMS